IRLAAPAVSLDHFEDRADIVFHVEAAKDRRLLRQIADSEPRPLVHRKISNLVAIELDLAALGLDQAGNHVERRGLTRAVGPQQTDRLAAPHVEADPVDHPASAVGLFKIMRGQIAPDGLLPGLWGVPARS